MIASTLLLLGAIAFQLLPARATVGGPELAEVLGWIPSEQKVFFRIHYVGESGEAPGVFYFDLTSADPAKPQRISWSFHRDFNDSTYSLRYARLLKRLTPLRQVVPSETFVLVNVIHADTVTNEWYGRWVRYRIRARSRFFEGTVEATTFGDTSLRVIAQYEIPGRSERVGIGSFLGTPWEGGYEIQVPFILPKRDEVVRLEWKRL
jgi:hypothetical protein